MNLSVADESNRILGQSTIAASFLKSSRFNLVHFDKTVKCLAVQMITLV